MKFSRLTSKMLTGAAGILLLAASVLPVHAFTVRLWFNKPFAVGYDTNYVIATKISPNILSDGGVTPIGVPLRLQPGTNGLMTNYFAQGFYSLTNPVSRLGVVINVYDNGTQSIDYTNLLYSGFNTYAIVYGSNQPPSYQQITNALGYVPGNATSTNFAHIYVTNDATIGGLLSSTEYKIIGYSSDTEYVPRIDVDGYITDSVIAVTNVATLTGNTTMSNAIVTGLSSHFGISTNNGSGTNNTFISPRVWGLTHYSNEDLNHYDINNVDDILASGNIYANTLLATNSVDTTAITAESIVVHTITGTAAGGIDMTTPAVTNSGRAKAINIHGGTGVETFGGNLSLFSGDGATPGNISLMPGRNLVDAASFSGYSARYGTNFIGTNLSDTEFYGVVNFQSTNVAFRNGATVYGAFVSTNMVNQFTNADTIVSNGLNAKINAIIVGTNGNYVVTNDTRSLKFTAVQVTGLTVTNNGAGDTVQYTGDGTVKWDGTTVFDLGQQRIVGNWETYAGRLTSNSVAYAVVSDVTTASNGLVTRLVATNNALSTRISANTANLTTVSNNAVRTNDTRSLSLANLQVTDLVISNNGAGDKVQINGTGEFKWDGVKQIDLGAGEFFNNWDMISGTIFSNSIAYATRLDITTSSNGLYSSLTTTSNGIITRLIATNNALTTAYGAADTVTSNGLVTRLVATNNALITAYGAADTVTSNGIIARVITNGQISVAFGSISINANTNVYGSTDIIAGTKAGTAAAIGTFKKVSGTLYTNTLTGGYITNAGTTWNCCNSAAGGLYSSTSLTNSAWSITFGAAPALSTTYGEYIQGNGLVILDELSSTNLDARFATSSNGILAKTITNNNVNAFNLRNTLAVSTNIVITNGSGRWMTVGFTTNGSYDDAQLAVNGKVLLRYQGGSGAVGLNDASENKFLSNIGDTTFIKASNTTALTITSNKVTVEKELLLNSNITAYGQGSYIADLTFYNAYDQGAAGLDRELVYTIGTSLRPHGNSLLEATNIALKTESAYRTNLPSITAGAGITVTTNVTGGRTNWTLASSSSTTVENPLHAQLKIYWFGDSISARNSGAGGSGFTGMKNLPTALAEYNPWKMYVAIDNTMAEGGETLENTYNTLDQNYDGIKVTDTNTVIAVASGYNDGANAIQWWTNLMFAIHAKWPLAKRWAINVPNSDNSPNAEYMTNLNNFEATNSSYYDKLVDFRSVLIPTSDSIHPTEEGYNAMLTSMVAQVSIPQVALGPMTVMGTLRVVAPTNSLVDGSGEAHQWPELDVEGAVNVGRTFTVGSESAWTTNGGLRIFCPDDPITTRYIPFGLYATNNNLLVMEFNNGTGQALFGQHTDGHMLLQAGSGGSLEGSGGAQAIHWTGGGLVDTLKFTGSPSITLNGVGTGATSSSVVQNSNKTGTVTLNYTAGILTGTTTASNPVSYSSNRVTLVASGWTNNLGVNAQVCFTNLTATLSDSTGSNIVAAFGASTIYHCITMSPNWRLTGTGFTGSAIKLE